MENQIVLIVFGVIALIIVANIFKFVMDFFSNRKRYQEVYAIHSEVNKQVRPRLSALEQKFNNDKDSGDHFGKYVFGILKDNFKGKDEKLVEKSICKCCSEYAGAECKEDFCLEGCDK